MSADLVPPPARERLDVRSADGTRLRVSVHGPHAAPTVVLAHGWTCSARTWSRVVRAAPELRTVTYDQRGHGESAEPGPAGWTVRALADDLAAVLGAVLPAGRRAVVAGHSMGAMAVVALAAEHPAVLADRVAAVLLASTGVHQLATRMRVVPMPYVLGRATRVLTERALGDPVLLRRLPRPAAAAVLKRITLSPAATPAEVAANAEVILGCPAATHTGFGKLLAGLDLRPQLAALRSPALVLVGSRDRLTPPWHARRLTAALPRPLGLLEVPHVGHMTPIQSPAAVGSVLAWLVREHLREEAA